MASRHVYTYIKPGIALTRILETVVTFHFSGGVVVALLFYVHGKHLRSCRDGQFT